MLPHFVLNSSPMDEAAANQRAVDVGHAFVEEIQQIEAATDGWRNFALADTLVAATLDRALLGLAETGLWGKANQLPSSALWRVAGSWLERGSLQAHARHKPRGYAGDFELLSRIWSHYVTPDPIGRPMDVYFQRQAAAHVVRARIEMVATQLVDHVWQSKKNSYRVVNIGCGPAIDIALAAERLPETQRKKMEVCLLDLDPAAVEHATARVRPWFGERATVSRENLFRFHDRMADRYLTGADAVICIGLVDYFSAADLARFLQKIWSRLAEGGFLLVGNFQPQHPTRAYMEWGGNWYLVYRTLEELAACAEESGLPQGQWRIGSEAIGANLFLHAWK